MIERNKPRVALVWTKWGPYHYARFQGLIHEWGEENCLGVALAGQSRTYAWSPVDDNATTGTVVILNPDLAEEDISPWDSARQVFHLFKREQIKIALLPSYWPAPSLSILLAARCAGARCIMMNESHALTEQASGIKRWVKRQILRLFDAGLIGGIPQKEHFISLGMSASHLFDGYDTVDNDYFLAMSIKARLNKEKSRRQLGLPKHYILNLGRMVEKKNIPLLIKAYAEFSCQKSALSKHISLVLIGSGPAEPALKKLCLDLGLEVKNLVPHYIPEIAAKIVYFGGFRQIEENPTFFALCDVFVLPSHTEEWGLVVNEAMACGSPIIASKNVGSAADLVKANVNGYQFDPKNISELVACLEMVFSSEEKRHQMGQASQEIISNWGCERFGKHAIQAIGQVRKN